MDINKRPMNISGVPQCAFMLEADFFKAPPGGNIAPLNDCIYSMQVIDGERQGGETCDY